jgi:hypothetical protein
MSTIKVDTLQTRSGNTAAVTGAGSLKVDNLRGNTAATSITLGDGSNTLGALSTAGGVTITGEGGTNTTNLQQGLAKCFCHYTTAGTFVNNSSFNTASLTDGGAGDCRVNFTTNMGSANGYSATRSANAFHTLDSEDNAGYSKTITYNSSNAAEDASRTQVTVHGDLA